MPLGLKMLGLIAFSEPPSDATWLENALKIAGAALLFPIAKAGRLRAFGATNFLGLGWWGLGRRRRLLLVFFDLGFIMHHNLF
jgi:hypothetical protein